MSSQVIDLGNPDDFVSGTLPGHGAEDSDLYDEEVEDSYDPIEGLDPESREMLEQLVLRTIVFCEKLSGIELHPYQTDFAYQLTESLIMADGEEITATWSRQSGKALALTTNIPTPEGWRKFGDLRPGDFVYGPSGKPIQVQALTPVQLRRPCYKVTFADQTTITADAAHEWVMADGSVIETTELAQRAAKRSKHAINMTEPVHGYESKLEADPYTLGTWLADGNSRDARVTTPDQEIIDRIKAAPDGYSIVYRDSYGPYGFNVEGLYPQLRALGVVRRKNQDGTRDTNKRIPPQYLRASVADRLALLQGIMDGDGYVSKDGACEYTTVSRELAEDVLELMRSLGYRARITEGQATISGRYIGPKYRIHFASFQSSPVCAFSLPRKRGRLREAPKDSSRSQNQYAVSVEKVDSVPVRCIQVEGGVFLAGEGWVPTHNSETVSVIISGIMVLFPILAKVESLKPLMGRFARGVWVGLFAPVDSQSEFIFGRVADKLTSETAEQIISDPEISVKAKAGAKVVRLSHGSFARRQTANPNAKIEGSSYHIIIIDEAQEADEFVVRKCYAEGTQIYTPTGVHPIEDVVKGQKDVLSYTKDWEAKDGLRLRREIGELVRSTPVEWHDNGVQDVWRISLASGRSVEATWNHRWISRRRQGNGLPKTRTTSELRVGDGLPLSMRAGDHLFTDHGTEDEGYFIGSMLGDGCMSGAYPQWCGFDGPTQDRMSRFVDDLGASVKVSNVNDSGLIEVRFTADNGNSRGANPVTSFLREEKVWGLKGARKSLPHLNYSQNFLKGWVEGLIDADGCVENKAGKCISFANISETLVRQLSDVLLYFGIYSNVWSYKQPGSYGDNPSLMWALRVKSSDHIRKFGATFQLTDPAKQGKLNDLIERSSTVEGRRVVTSQKRVYASDDPEGVVFDRIVSIEYVGKKQTYCVTVPEDSHLVVVNGVVSSNSIHPMLASTAGPIVKIGTPSFTKGDYYKAIQNNKRRETKRGGKRYHFENNWRVVAKYNEFYKKFVEKEKLRLGEDSDEFQLSYELKWMIERGMFVTEDKLDYLADKQMHRIRSWTATPCVAGIDVARVKDSTVVTVCWVDWEHPDPAGLYEHRILDWLEITNADWESQYYQIADFLAPYNIARCGVDSQGMGSAVAERLDLILGGRMEVIPVQSDSATQDKRWRHLTQILQRDMLIYPGHSNARRTRAWKRFRQQMTDAEKVVKGQYLLVAAPSEAKDSHDDYVDSLAIATSMSIESLLGDEVEVLEAPWYR